MSDDFIRADSTERKEAILRQLLEEWEKAPQLRLGQFIANTVSDESPDDFNFRRLLSIEDTILIARMIHWNKAQQMDEALK